MSQEKVLKAEKVNAKSQRSAPKVSKELESVVKSEKE